MYPHFYVLMVSIQDTSFPARVWESWSFVYSLEQAFKEVITSISNSCPISSGLLVKISHCHRYVINWSVDGNM